MLLLQLLFDALALGAAYALVALGFVLILNATGAVNFAQGELVMAGGFGALLLARLLPSALAQWGLLLLPALLAGMALLGLLVAALAYLPLRRRPPEAVFLSTIAVGIVVQNAATLLFGPEPRAVPALAGEGAWQFAGLVLSRQKLAIILVAAVLGAGLHAMFTRTQLGRRLRAASQDREVAAAIGIDVDGLALGVFAAGVALAGTAGLLLGHNYFVTPDAGGGYMLKAYIAATLGGWGSLPGAVLGALLIAVLEVVWPALPALVPALPDGPPFTQPMSAVVLDAGMLLILLLRPHGLLGPASRIRA
jgi:branched-chain amino acid transport system permease protein